MDDFEEENTEKKTKGEGRGAKVLQTYRYTDRPSDEAENRKKKFFYIHFC